MSGHPVPKFETSVLVSSMQRSGGTLVGALLDGHPSCNVFPFEYWHTRRKAEYDGRVAFHFAELPLAERLERCGVGRALASKVGRVHAPEAGAAFVRRLTDVAQAASDQADFYRRLAAIYFEEVAREPQRPVLVNHCANLCLWSDEERDQTYGPSHQIVTIRDPRAAIVSLGLWSRRKERSFGPEQVDRFCAEWISTVERYWGTGRSDVTVWRFEDTLARPDGFVAAVCADLGIPRLASPARPTRRGELYAANSSLGEYRGVDRKAADAWRDFLAPSQRALVEERLGKAMAEIGYGAEG